MNRLVVHFGALPPSALDVRLLAVLPAALVSPPLIHSIPLSRDDSSSLGAPHRNDVERPPTSDLFNVPFVSPMAIAETPVEPVIRETVARALPALGAASGAPAGVLLDRPALSRVWTFGSLLGGVTCDCFVSTLFAVG